MRQMNTITMLGPNNSSGSYMNYGASRNNGNNSRNLNRCFATDLAPEFINTDLLVQQRYWAYNGATASGQESGVCAAIFKIITFYTVTCSEILHVTYSSGWNYFKLLVYRNGLYEVCSCSVVVINRRIAPQHTPSDGKLVYFFNCNTVCTLSLFACCPWTTSCYLYRESTIKCTIIILYDNLVATSVASLSDK
jgi:hypothetical protein